MAFATARPMPLPAPVTIAIFFMISPMPAAFYKVKAVCGEVFLPLSLLRKRRRVTFI
jgi:hypothetical protein